MSTLPVVLERDGAVPLGVQLSTQIRERILDESLPEGHRLPSSRALAAELGTSRSVVEQAYSQLVAEGWLRGRHGSGTFVASRGLRRAASRRTAEPAAARPLVTLDAGTPFIDPRHAAGWRRAWREVSTATPPRGYDDSRGLPELRRLLAERLARTRGLACEPEQVVVTSGTTDGLRHLLGALPPGAVGVEDPGYRAAVATARQVGREVRDLPAIDPDGWALDGLTAVYVTPAHQHPLGHVMSASQRLHLLDRARASDALVIEDDYDSEFRYDVAPIPALASLAPERVGYLGTAAKSVGPSMRIGWLVAPPEVTDAVNARRTATHDAAPWPVQRAFLTLVRDGYLDRVVRSARRVYAERAQRVTEALRPYATPSTPSPAGMYTTWLLPHADAVRARDAALAAGYQVNLLADYCRSAGLTGLLVGVGGVTDAQLDEALAALVRGLAG
ncbi:MAG TPA: PLP-dependent aminotransferase family protein [Actinotalea caeni]|uniref:MocR-like pyridoxine biosynthesis transcription factor PdxR n=1 Tax=Actinotalea caeni TaxID=1348467 RepID=UPI002B4AE91D|nr:PLP-dependent aminotransferase family protein [Actinotalea caeni]HLV54101.1 PLP-dependent aminotransferase family protein [Actinotalea caeni]